VAEKKIAAVISTEQAERQYITVDGVDYEMVGAEDLELRDSMWLMRAGKKLSGMASEDATDEDVQALDDLLDRMVHTILPSLPEEIHGRLRARHKLSIAMAFTTAADLGGMGSRQTGTPDSPDSSASTEAPAPTGSDAQSPPPSGT